MLNQDQYFTGTVVEVIDPVLYQIKVDIPGIAIGVPAFPMRGEIDEPRVGDFVLLRSLDPVFKSYYLYQKIKENNFIGFRSNGKMVDITPDYVTVAIYDPETEYNDSVKDETFRPEPTDWVKLDKEGNLEVNLRANSNITITGSSSLKIDTDSKIEISGNSEISVSGNSNINVSGSTKLNCPDVTITGGKLTMKGQSNTDLLGPFNAIPTCPFSGAPHCGSIVSGT